MRVVVIFVVLATACGADTELGPTIELADVELSPPSGWRMQELGETTRMWVPENNTTRKESITVIVAPRFLGDGERALAAASRAQGTLRDRRLLAESRVATRTGLAGRRFDVQFRPDAGGGRLYERTHVVLVVAGDHLVHVLYTAAQPDPDRVALNAVLASLKAGG